MNDENAKLSAPTGGMPDAPIQSVVDTLLHQVRNRLDFDRSVLINVLQDIAPLRAFDKATLANKLSAPAGMPDRPRRFCADTVGNMHIDAHGGYVSVDDYETLCTFAQARAEAKLPAPAGGMPSRPELMPGEDGYTLEMAHYVEKLQSFAQARAEEATFIKAQWEHVLEENAKYLFDSIELARRVDTAELLAATATQRAEWMEADARRFKTWLHERSAWLLKEMNSGGNIQHLNTRKQECDYIAQKFFDAPRQPRSGNSFST